jgi:hypothetical protein
MIQCEFASLLFHFFGQKWHIDNSNRIYCFLLRTLCNQNPYIEEEQTTQWLKAKVQKDKQRSTKHAHKTKDLVTRTH